MCYSITNTLPASVCSSESSTPSLPVQMTCHSFGLLMSTAIVGSQQRHLVSDYNRANLTFHQHAQVTVQRVAVTCKWRLVTRQQIAVME